MSILLLTAVTALIGEVSAARTYPESFGAYVGGMIGGSIFCCLMCHFFCKPKIDQKDTQEDIDSAMAKFQMR